MFSAARVDDFKARVAERPRDHQRTAVVPVEARFRHQNPVRRIGRRTTGRNAPRPRSHRPAVATADLVERLCDLPEARDLYGLHQFSEDIAAGTRHFLEPPERFRRRRPVASPKRLHPRHLVLFRLRGGARERNRFGRPGIRRRQKVFTPMIGISPESFRVSYKSDSSWIRFRWYWRSIAASTPPRALRRSNSASTASSRDP